jgi:hypothetical protein
MRTRLRFAGIAMLLAAGMPFVAAPTSAAASPRACAGGPSTADAPPAPPTGPGACRSHPQVGTTGPAGRRPVDAVPHSGYHWLGGQTQGYTSAGIYGTLNVVDPKIVHGNTDFLANRIMAKSCDSTRWLELGWAEVSWRADAQYIYSYNTVQNQWQFFDQYPIAAGSRITVSVVDVGNGVWEAQLWWNGAWNTLVSVNPGTGIGCGNEQYVEVYTAGTGQNFAFPTVTVGDGTANGMRLSATAGQWHSWDQTIGMYETNAYENYVTTWLTRYWSWQVSSTNTPPFVTFSVTPSQGLLTTSFFASGSASDPDGDAVTSRIYWGDGTSTEGTSGSHTYSSTGSRTVTFEATDARGAVATQYRSVRVCLVIVKTSCAV